MALFIAAATDAYSAIAGGGNTMLALRVAAIATAAAAVALGFFAAVSGLLTGLGAFGSRAAFEAFGTMILTLPLLALGASVPLVVGLRSPRRRIVSTAAWGTLILVWCLATASVPDLRISSVGSLHFGIATARAIMFVGVSATLVGTLVATGQLLGAAAMFGSIERLRHRSWRKTHPVTLSR